MKAWQCALARGQIFWTDLNDHSIKSCDIRDGSNLEIIKRNVGEPVDMDVFHEGGQPKNVTNPCANRPCPHICVLVGPEGHVCLCPKGLTMSPDGLFCEGIDLNFYCEQMQGYT